MHQEHENFVTTLADLWRRQEAERLRRCVCRLRHLGNVNRGILRTFGGKKDTIADVWRKSTMGNDCKCRTMTSISPQFLRCQNVQCITKGSFLASKSCQQKVFSLFWDDFRHQSSGFNTTLPHGSWKID